VQSNSARVPDQGRVGVAIDMRYDDAMMVVVLLGRDQGLAAGKCTQR